MAEREKIIRFYKGTEGEEAAVRLTDYAEAVKKTGRFRTSAFLDPFGQEIAETVAANYALKLDFDGGYLGAERACASFCDPDFKGTVNYGLCVLDITWNDKFYRPSHRDVLGALMGLGLERKNFGDIIFAPGCAKVLCLEKTSSFVLENLTSVGKASVSCVKGQMDSIAPREERCKEIRATVASLRLDSIAAAGYGTSRSKMASEIAAEKIKLNWQSVKNASQAVKEGDVLSIRGRGRLEICEITGTTKKGRIGILLKRYI